MYTGNQTSYENLSESMKQELEKLKSPIINDLTTGGVDKALSAEMGKDLKAQSNEIKHTVTEHVTEIATVEKLGHIKPDGETIKVDPITGVASVLASGEVNQINVIKDYSSNALGSSTVASEVTYLSFIKDVNDTKKSFTVASTTGLAVGNTVNIHHVYDGIIGTGTVAAINGTTVTLNTIVSFGSLVQFISIIPSKATGIRGSFASGLLSFASGLASIALGLRAQATGSTSFAIGTDAISSGSGALAIGSGANALGNSSKVIGNGIASADSSCVIGNSGTASGKGSIAIGGNIKAIGEYSYAQGYGTSATASHSHSQNYYTDASNYGSTAIGLHNKTMTGSPTSFSANSDAFVIGNQSNVLANGTNAFRVTFDGKTYGLSAFNSTGADYAEYFEWLDSNPRNQDRVGYVVTLDKGKIRKATSKDSYILGVISATPSVIGDSCQDDWNGKYLTDKWGRIQYHWIDVEYEELVTISDENNLHNETVKKTRKDYVPKINPNWNPDQVYTPREERAEWDAVGLVGKLLVRDDGTLFPNNFAKVGSLDGELTLSEEPTNIRVMERVTPNIVRVFIK